MEDKETTSETSFQNLFNIDFFRRNTPLLFLALLGLVSIGVGIYIFYQKASVSEDKIEIIPLETKVISTTIAADIEGAIERPGVYRLPSGSRVEDLLIMAGGFSAQADRSFVEKSLNRAQKLTDGAKIYIPEKGAAGSVGVTSASEGIVGASAGNAMGQVNINTATESQLDKLSGIGPVTAQKIINGRPYQSVEDLLTKKIVSKTVFNKILNQLTIY
ncbi:MAG: ComEA family DNA-binding protein [bacterium]|nr:ComEA family DNA-binding protein [bacterium]